MTIPTLADATSTLPAPPNRLIGREGASAAVAALLCRDDVRLVTVTGPGGAGKTHLSLEVAHRLTCSFAGGVVFVSLASVREPQVVLSTLAHELGIRESRGQSMLSVLKDALGGRQLLIVLDNLEQVISAAADINELVLACPSVTLLVTSRSPLRLRAEREYPLSPLDLPTAEQPRQLSVLAENSAISLFVERAQAARPAFALSDTNAVSVIEICRHLDGLPLAIELAAAMTRVLSPQALLARMTNRLLLLTESASDLPDRHRSLRDTIAWSYNLLDPAEQALFRQLAVFRGGFTMEAIEDVVDVSEPIDTLTFRESSHTVSPVFTLGLLASLVNKSLLLVREDVVSDESLDDDGSRYYMLSTILDFAAETLEKSVEFDTIQGRHLEWCRSLAERIAPELTGPLQAKLLARLDSERENFRAALTTALEHYPESGLRLATALWRYWATRGFLTEGYGWLTRLLEVGTDVDAVLRARASGRRTSVDRFGRLCRPLRALQPGTCSLAGT